MSNFYAKAINPRTKVEEDCTFIDMGKDTFIEFKDGWKYNTKFFNSEVTEQEAINDDIDLGDPISPQEAFMYLLVGCIAMIPLVIGVVYCIKYVWGVILKL